MAANSSSDQQHQDWIAAARQAFQHAQRAGGSSGEGLPLHGDRLAQSSDIPSFEGYDIVRRIHRGGQGVVYEAIQQSTRRTVALKVLHERGRFAGPSGLMRFEREVSILAHLDHRNIIGVLDRGTADGQNYFVMDYVNGRPVVSYAQENNLSLRDRLEMFTKICDAVSAAHLRGIIHRDLKPGNILIDNSGEPRILDFGLAKVFEVGDETDRESATVTGQFVGSLPWASPEQARGRMDDVDVRSDVYSLGVILYQLLTDRFPYTTIGDLDQALVNIRSAAPARPGSLNRDIDTDLDTISLKCLEKEPERRYQSVGELAADVRHYLNNEPIAARRDSIAYLLGKSFTRHKIAFALAASFVVVVSIFAIVSASLWQRAAWQRDQAILAQSKERSQRLRADSESEKAGAVVEFLQTMLSSSQPEVSGAAELSIREVLDDAAKRVEGGSFSRQPEVEGKIRLTLGLSYLSIGQLDTAEKQLNRAREIMESASSNSTDDYAEVLQYLGVLERRRNKLAQSEAYQRQAITLFQSLHPGDFAQTAFAMSELALVLDLAGKHDEAIMQTRESISMMKRTLGEEHVNVAAMQATLATRSHDMKNFLPLAIHAYEVTRAVHGDQHPDVARALRVRANAKLATQDQQGARQDYVDALQMMREMLGDENPDTLNCACDLAFALEVCGEQQKGLAILEELIDDADRTYGPVSPFRFYYLWQYARTLNDSGDKATAERLLREGLELAKKCDKSEAGTGMGLRLDLADILLDRSDLAGATPLIEETWEIYQRHPRAFSTSGLANIECLRAELLTSQGRFREAEDLLIAATGRMKKQTLTNKKTGRGVRSMIQLYEAWDRVEPGTGKAEKAAEWRAKLPPTPPTTTSAPA